MSLEIRGLYLDVIRPPRCNSTVHLFSRCSKANTGQFRLLVTNDCVCQRTISTFLFIFRTPTPSLSSFQRVTLLSSSPRNLKAMRKEFPQTHIAASAHPPAGTQSVSLPITFLLPSLALTIFALCEAEDIWLERHLVGRLTDFFY